jgi:hypothetical protein
VLSVALTGIAQNTTTNLISRITPYRIWGAWINIRFSSFAAYAAGLGFVDARIQDGQGNSLLHIGAELQAASQIVNETISIPIPGFTPLITGTHYLIQVVLSAAPANCDFSAGMGVYWSII